MIKSLKPKKCKWSKCGKTFEPNQFLVREAVIYI